MTAVTRACPPAQRTHAPRSLAALLLYSFVAISNCQISRINKSVYCKPFPCFRVHVACMALQHRAMEVVLRARLRRRPLARVRA
jgi:hypothetical protein